MKHNIIRPYGDKSGDGKVQLSFTLPVPPDDWGKEAAKQLLKQMGFEDIIICGIRDFMKVHPFYCPMCNSCSVIVLK
jgi:beta-lysine 5,6-aminomutase beta subunit